MSFLPLGYLGSVYPRSLSLLRIPAKAQAPAAGREGQGPQDRVGVGGTAEEEGSG